MKQKQADIFLLTKPPFNTRSGLCIKLAARSENARIYLAGDGVYHLFAGLEELQGCKVYACKEDMEARAIKPGEKVVVPDDFYAALIEDIMEHCKHGYTF